MIRKKLFKIISLSLSLSIASMGFAFATDNQNLDEPVSIEITAEDEAMYARQAEIDKMLFEKYSKELTDEGISVTHTGAVDDYIEVGITPYTQEAADIVMELLGADDVKVVEGNMAVTLQYNPELNVENPDPRVIMAPEELADDSQIVTATEDIVEEAEVASATDAVEDDKDISTTAEEEKEEEKGISPVILGVGAVAIIGIGAVMFKKKVA